MTDEYKDWINEKLPYFRLMSSQLASVIENILKQNNIAYFSVESRTKELNGIEEKIKRKNYKDPISQLTDIAGIRVILYIEDDLMKVCNIIRETFEVDIKNSSDDTQRLSIDRIGYRSTHFVCDVGEARSIMKEYTSFTGLKFEVQIRTILQHAWANLTHDRNYKFGGTLPKNIERKINLYSGMLEIVDMGFSEVINDIEMYKQAVAKKEVSEYIDDRIDSFNLVEFINRLAAQNNYKLMPLKLQFDNEELINELHHLNVFNISELDKLIPGNIFQNLKKHEIETTYVGVVRDAMIISDYHKLSQAPDRRWTSYLEDEDYSKAQSFYTEYMPEENFYEMMDLLE